MRHCDLAHPIFPPAFKHFSPSTLTVASPQRDSLVLRLTQAAWSKNSPQPLAPSSLPLRIPLFAQAAIKKRRKAKDLRFRVPLPPKCAATMRATPPPALRQTQLFDVSTPPTSTIATLLSLPLSTLFSSTLGQRMGRVARCSLARCFAPPMLPRGCKKKKQPPSSLL